MRWKNIISILLIVLLITSLLPLVSFNSKGQGPYTGEVIAKDGEGNDKYYFREGDELYFKLDVDDNDSDQSRFVTITVEKINNRSVLDEMTVRTDNNGTYESWKQNRHFDLSDYDLGTYILNITDPTPGDYQTSTFEIYEPNYKRGSSIYTTDKQFEEEYHYFQKSDAGNVKLYYKIELLDQHGNPMPHPTRPPVKVKLKNQNILETYDINVNPDGTKKIMLTLNQPNIGDYRLFLFNNDGSIEFARSEIFTITDFRIDSPKRPEEIIYTQGENITIDIKGGYPENIDISIVNETGGRTLESWTEVQIENGSWSTKYKIPEDEPDGVYHILIIDHSTQEEIIGLDSVINNFKIQKFRLDLYTDKNAYLAGERVDVFYTAANIIDGSKVEDISVDWRASFELVEDNYTVESGSTAKNKFSFSVPKNAVQTPFVIDVWANDTKGNTNHYHDEIPIGTLRGTLQLDKNEYLMGETVFVNVKSFVDYPSSWDEQSPVKDANVKVEILDPSGNVIEQYTEDTVTGDNGGVTVPINLEDDVKAGPYSIKVNITKNNDYKTYSSEFEIVDPDNRLTIYVDSLNEADPYYPGDSVNLDYVIKKNFEIINEANVKYKVYSKNKVYHYDFANNGQILFNIPKDYDPSETLYLDIFAQISEECRNSKTFEVTVKAGYILLNSNRMIFKPGDNIKFTYEYGGVEEVNNIYYKIIEKTSEYQSEEDHIIENGILNDSDLNFRIPDNPSDVYKVEIEVITSTGNRFSDSININRWKGYDLDIELLTESDYTDGVFKPGQELKFRYKLKSRGESSLPETITINYGFMNLGVHKQLETTDKKGTFSIKIPDKGNGDYIFSISSNSEGNYDTYDYESEIVQVEENPSWTDKKAVLGLSLLNLVILLIAVLALIAALISNFRGKSISLPHMKKSTKKKLLKKKKSEEGQGEEKSAAEKAHEWSGPTNEPEEESSEPDVGEETQIEPDEPRW